jgi:hypothetical protein
MAILMTAEVPGMTQEMVDGMAAALKDQMKAHPGFVVHTNGPVDGGWRVVEVWDSEELFTAWYEGSVKPNLPEGIEPQVTSRELHDMWLQ